MGSPENDEAVRVEYARDNHLISLSLSKDNDVCGVHDHHDHHTEDDDNESFYAYRERTKTCREKVGECLVSVTCTGIVGLVLSLCVVIAAIGLAKIVAAGMYWRLCPISPKLPTYLLVSGLMPALFYVTCRTRRKCKGAVPGKQRIVARWEFSVLHYTFDTERSWQAGLAAVLSVFLMIWLCFGTALTVITMKRMEAKPANCVMTGSQPHHHHGNASVTNSTSLASSSKTLMSLSLSKANSSSLSSALLSSRTNASLAAGTPMTLHPPVRLDAVDAGKVKHADIDTKGKNDTLPSLVHSLVNGTSNGHHILRANASKSSNDSRSPSHSDRLQYSGDTPLEVRKMTPADFTDDVRLTSSPAGESYAAISDVTEPPEVTSSGKNLACLDCDKTFLTLCFSFVLFDWAYVIALLLNLIIVGTVPCCCFKRIAHV